ncbi:calcium/calmodulin-regulated receptor-like kinase 1 isoform X1 [Phoenix dactylifera]|uniref:Calcium/calmodulin-regulated receptor-like kinase 1 isoform X1 n=2 Tax=Phoenix dactylifera TaxID=42345 RepID=A0A8B7BHJ3_PHODC|nr:calcium/calmodulin-regulated receptor-like kinase 1 isoform X1 [Phoenix dactylifera]
MKGVSWGLIIGVTIGVVIGVLLAAAALLCIRFRKRRAPIGSSSSRRASTIPIRANGVDTCTELSDSTAGQESPKFAEERGMSSWPEGPKRKNLVSVSGILKYCYRDLQKATSNFTTLLGQGAFGPVYKAQMPTGETVAVKVLATHSKQGEKEFQTEVLLLGRLHHRNLVNLVGYCSEKGQHMLIYEYMTNGSLASHLYSEKHEALSWDWRINIALDVARGLEYLHDGVSSHIISLAENNGESKKYSKALFLLLVLMQAVPPVVHRDIKSSNILLDRSMRARVADFGLSREEMVSRHASNIRGTYGYLDPEYVSSRSFTKKSDVYSYGILLFELITGRNPPQGLMEYVELAAINSEGRAGWEEIADSRLDGIFDVRELNVVAALAYKCISRISRKRPSMRDMVQALTRVVKARHGKRHRSERSLPFMAEEESTDQEPSDLRTSISEHQRGESIDSLSDLPDV